MLITDADVLMVRTVASYKILKLPVFYERMPVQNALK